MTSPFTDVLDLDPEELHSLVEAIPRLHAWYCSAARDLPWRRTSDPYAVWISEVMLQQTRVATVIPYFERWVAALPTVAALAGATEGQVFKLWEGLGYYSRARNLHLASKEIVAHFGGRVPRTPAEFQSLPGVGSYTVAAVLSIAFGLDLPVLDGNVLRVFSRLTALNADPRRPPAAAALQALAERLLPAHTAQVHNQALMELGALVCTPRAPSCQACPLSAECRAQAAGQTEVFPVKTPKRAVPHRAVAIGIVFREGQVFIDRRPYGGMLGGLWEFPGGKIETGETAADALTRELREEFGMEVVVGRALPTVDHAYTHLKVTLHPYLCRFASMRPQVGEGQPFRWVAVDELERYAMPKANWKVIEKLSTLTLKRLEIGGLP